MDDLIRQVDVRDGDAFARPMYELAKMHAHLVYTRQSRA